MKAGADGPAGIRVIRSRKRKKTVSVRQVGDILEVRAPASIADKDLQPIIDNLRGRIQRRRRRQPRSDEALWSRAQELQRKYFDRDLNLKSIRYVTNQDQRYGSCTTSQGTIRISDRMKTYPLWVLDYVLVHELAHLIHSDHSAAFWEVVSAYPLSERARGFLMGAGFDHDADV